MKTPEAAPSDDWRRGQAASVPAIGACSLDTLVLQRDGGAFVPRDEGLIIGEEEPKESESLRIAFHAGGAKV